MARPRFHLALTVDDLGAARAFYGDVLGCSEGRASERWVDFDFFGHQISCHLADETTPAPAVNPVDGDAVPVPHFGVILELPEWRALRAHLEASGLEFVLGPRVRFEGEPGEQATMFFCDPAGNRIEVKAFGDDGDVFRTEPD